MEDLRHELTSRRGGVTERLKEVGEAIAGREEEKRVVLELDVKEDHVQELTAKVDALLGELQREALLDGMALTRDDFASKFEEQLS